MIHIHHGDYRQVLSHVKADLIMTSPPYNIGSKSPRIDGQRKLGKYDPKSFRAITDYPDSLPEPVYQFEQSEFLIWCAEHLNPDGVLVYNHKPRRNGKVIHPAEWFLLPEVRSRLVLMEEVIWDRGSTHNHCPQTMWQQTERLYVFKRTGGNYGLKNHKYSDVWRIVLNRGTRIKHNAPFPEELAERIIECWSRPGNLVCDPYSGSGTSAVAAARLNRAFEGAEVLKKYHSMATTRLDAELRMAA